MFLLSYIVPVFNSAKYLIKCLDSIMNQGLEEDQYEIILINDGSTDKSLEICHDYQEKHNCIKVISQENSGVASARNAGLAIAAGKYVCFVDSDDYLTTNCISAVLNEIGNNNVQLIRFWSIILEEGERGPAYQKGIINFEGKAFEYVSRFGFDTFCCTFLYDRLWLLESGIQFEPFKMAEDCLFITKLLLLDPSVISTTYRVYNYVKHSSSATGDRSPEHSALCARDLVSVIYSLMSFSYSLVLDEKIKDILTQSAQGKMRSFISRVLSSNISTTEFRQMIRKLKEIKILPVENKSGGLSQKMISMVINLISTFPFLLRPLRSLYVRIFIPILLPHIGKN